MLVAVIDAGSMSAAARQLGVPLATVSRKIADLEAYLNTRLLHRTTRQLSRPRLESRMSPVAGASSTTSRKPNVPPPANMPRGELIVTAPIVFGRLHIVPVLAAFLAHYPEIDVRLVLTDRVTHLMEEQIDVALRIGELPDSSFMATRVGSVRRVICASPAYLAAHGTPAEPADLARHQCITFEVLASRRAWVFDGEKGELTVPVHSRFAVNTAEAAIDAAVLGVGLIRVLSYQVAQALRDRTLDVVLDAFESQPLPVSLVHKGQAPMPLKLRAFLDLRGGCVSGSRGGDGRLNER